MSNLEAKDMEHKQKVGNMPNAYAYNQHNVHKKRDNCSLCNSNFVTGNMIMSELYHSQSTNLATLVGDIKPQFGSLCIFLVRCVCVCGVCGGEEVCKMVACVKSNIELSMKTIFKHI